jgi:hypothetical protein
LATPAENVLITGVTLEGADWDRAKEALTLTNSLSTSLPGLVLTWKNKEVGQAQDTLQDIPIYLNETRLDHVFTVKMRLPQDIPSSVFFQRGTALTIWSPPV